MAQQVLKVIRVFSSNIKTAAYDTKSKTLYLTFINRPMWEYSYYHIPPRVWTGFVRADSKGQYFIGHIRDQYAYTRKTIK